MPPTEVEYVAAQTEFAIMMRSSRVVTTPKRQRKSGASGIGMSASMAAALPHAARHSTDVCTDGTERFLALPLAVAALGKDGSTHLSPWPTRPRNLLG